MANINWFGKPTKPTKQNKKQVSFLGLKPAKKTNYLGLTGKYGDRDFDGSPNHWDCSPNNPAKDGKFADTLKKIKSSYAYAQNPIKAIHQQQAEKVYGRKVEAVGTNLQRVKEATTKKEKKRAEKAFKKSLVSLDVAQYQKKLKAIQEKQAKEKRIIGGVKKYAGAVLGKQVMKGQILSSPVIKVRPDKYNLRREQTARAKAYASSPYQQQEIERIKTEVTKRNLGGRPTGTYTHSIPGVGPVHVYVWRKWMRQQKALARLRASQIQQQPVQATEQTAQMTPEELQMLQQQMTEQQIMQTNPELEAQTIDQLPAENKFTKNLQMLQVAYQREQYNRLVNEQPKGFVQQSVRQRQLLQQQAREFSRRNNLLHAHKAMLTPQENAIDFLNTSGSEVNILDTRNNNIMASRPDSIDLLNTGRRNILQADKLPNVSQGNIMNAERLNFGKINLTDEENI